MFQTICARIEGGDECEAIDSMASMAELVTIKTQRDGYKRSKPDINVERCLFTNKAAFFSDILKYLNLRGIKFAVEYFSGGSRPFWRLCEGINFYGNKNR
ncbi:MAG: hypothetical protein COV46_04050 [Deltaproteobacteria bacterium CG11_big_fil_rev_8_21_14_0_20_49_13]|nr:MAG: hypothetical protein COV46_04050 [Deltaproteobacteria bacterium CG11_big_fil_rev_8_21_14_0_20_49_13]